MKASIIVTTNNGKPDIHICEIGGYDVVSPSSEKELCILKKIFARHSEQIKKELAEEFSDLTNWQPKEFPTGLINPATGKEWVLSDYYVDKQGNKYFTHDEALKIWDSLPGWRPCTDEFHKILAKLVWDEDSWAWKENILGTGLNGFEYMNQKLGYELGGFRDKDTGGLSYVGNGGYIWSSTVSGTNGMNLFFDVTWLNPSNANSRAYGFQLRCLSE